MAERWSFRLPMLESIGLPWTGKLLDRMNFADGDNL